MFEQGLTGLVARLEARAAAAGVRLVAQPAAGDTTRRRMRQLAGPLPRELEQLLDACAGLTFDGGQVAFTDVRRGHSERLGRRTPWALFERRLHLVTEPGGTVFADLDAGYDGAVPVLALWLDPPVVMVLAGSLSEYLCELGRMLPAVSAGSAWDFRPGRLAPWHAAAMAGLASGAAGSRQAMPLGAISGADTTDVRDWAGRLPAKTGFVDLRRAVPGSGFVWGGQQPIEAFHRCPGHLLVGLVPGRRRPSLGSLLFGGGGARQRRRLAMLLQAQ